MRPGGIDAPWAAWRDQYGDLEVGVPELLPIFECSHRKLINTLLRAWPFPAPGLRLVQVAGGLEASWRLIEERTA